MCCVMPPNSPATTSVSRIASSSFVLPWSTWPMTVTTGGLGASSDSSTSSSSSSATISSSSPTISASMPSSFGHQRDGLVGQRRGGRGHLAWRGRGSSRCRRDPCRASRRCPAASRPGRRGASGPPARRGCERRGEVAATRRRRRWSRGAAGAAGAGGGGGGRRTRGRGWRRGRRAGRRSTEAGAAAGVGSAAAASATAVARLRGRGRSLRGFLLRLGLGLARGRRRLEHLATLRRLRGLAAGGSQPRHQVLGHAGGGGLARHPHLLQRRQQLLAGDPEFLRQFVDPHAAPIRSISSISLPTSSPARPVRNALPSTPVRPAASHARRVEVHVRSTTRRGPGSIDLAAPSAGRDDAAPASDFVPARDTRRRCGSAATPPTLTPRPAPPRLTSSRAARPRLLGRSSCGSASSSRDWSCGLVGHGRLVGLPARRRPSRRCGGRGGRRSRLVGDLGLRLDVDAPAGEPSGEPRVLAFLPDRERELVVGHDHHRGARALVDTDLLHLGGLQRVRDELGGVVATTAPRRSSRRAAR